jgi:hypothetical protein
VKSIQSSLLVFLAATVVVAGTPAASKNHPIEYNPNAEITIKGTVQEVVRHSVEGQVEIHLMVATEGHTVEVHLAPPYYLNWHQFRLRPGEDVEILAAKAKGEPHFLARRIKCGVRTLVLRDERGEPVWRKGR